MKRIFSLFVLALATAATLYAQNDSLIPFHSTGFDGNQLESIMVQRDGCIVTSTCVSLHEGNAVHTVGDIFHKVSPTGLCITDTLFVPDADWPPFYLFARNPLGDDNIRVSIRYEDNDSSYLHIAHFHDDDIEGNPSDETVVLLCEGRALDFFDNAIVDSRNDLIVTYYKSTEGGIEGHIARYGLDGTLKLSTVLPSQATFVPRIAQLSESPMRYFVWRRIGSQNVSIHVINDSLQLCDSYVIEKDYNPHVEQFTFTGSSSLRHDYFIPDGDDIVFATTYKRDSLLPVYDNQGNIVTYALNNPDSVEYGAAVARIGLSTGEMKKLQRFNELPGPETEVRHMGFQRMADNGFLYVFAESVDDNIADEVRLIVAVRFDSDLNVVWKRYCNPSNLSQASSYWGIVCTPFEDGLGSELGMAIAGICANVKNQAPGLFFLFVYDDGTVNVVDNSGIEMRPYAFYPNPVEGILRLDFSPDVQPASVELFDLQGRLVHRQDCSFESVNMSQLPAGIYTLRVTLNDGKSFSDKVVKE